jgi:thioesterase domain-containing protein
LVQVVFDQSLIPTSSLVPVQPLGTRPPLFFVHGSGGEPAGSLELSRCLGSDQPVYGLRSRGLCGAPAQHSIPEMAQYYVTCIRGLQPKGPYYLSGFCFGGMVAYEMARLLAAENETVALLAIFDAPAPGSLRITDCLRNRIRHDLWRLRRREMPLSFPILATRTRRAVRFTSRKIAAAIRRITGKSPDKDAKDMGQEILEVSKANIAAAKRYFPGVYPGSITLFWTSEAFALYGNDQYERWSAFGAGGTELHRTDGEHLRQLENPFVKTLAETLAKCMAHSGDPNPGSLVGAPHGLDHPSRSQRRGDGPGSLAQQS